MSEQPELERQTVQNTMLLPLWGRAAASKKYPDILNDQQAIEIIRKCDYDFSSIARTFKEFGGFCYVVRARKTEDVIRSYIRKHPRATIVNIGSGLDTSFSRVDNGKIRWYNLDLPDAIAFRHRFLPDTERNTSIAKSLLDTTWFDDISFQPQNGILFVSGGVFYYFKEQKLQKIVAAMAKRFPGGELYFDAESVQAVKKSNQMVQKTGNQGATMYFAVNDPKKFEKWSPNIHLIACDPFFKNIRFPQNVKIGMKLMARGSDLLQMMKFIHLRFS